MTGNYIPGRRIALLDGLRGLAVLLMCAHHFLYDCVSVLGAPETWFSNPVFDVLHYVFAGCFLLLSGISSRFSRAPLRRALRALGCAALITLITALLDMVILFGVLHLLALCMLFYALGRKLWERLSWQWAAAVCLLLIPVSNWLLTLVTAESGTALGYVLWFFGWNPALLPSTDYFPLFPWLFVFFLGVFLGKPVRDGALPRWFYETGVPFFPAVGRQALLIYLVHQPVLYGVTLLIKALR